MFSSQLGKLWLHDHEFIKEGLYLEGKLDQSCGLGGWGGGGGGGGGGMGWTLGSGSVKGWTSRNWSLNIAAEQHPLVVRWVKEEGGELVRHPVNWNSDGF